jgi:hypothetical protein
VVRLLRRRLEQRFRGKRLRQFDVRDSCPEGFADSYGYRPSHRRCRNGDPRELDHLGLRRVVRFERFGSDHLRGLRPADVCTHELHEWRGNARIGGGVRERHLPRGERLHAGRHRRLLVVCLVCGRREQQPGDEQVRVFDVGDGGRQGLPDPEGEWPCHRHCRHADRARLDKRDARLRLQRDRIDHVQGFRTAVLGAD